MNRDYAQYLLDKTTKDYNLIAKEFSSTRSFIWKDLEPLVQYIIPGDRVLDLGCGNGRLFQILKDKNIDYVGIDSSQELIKIAQSKYPEAKFQAADALNLPFPHDYFDKIYSIAVLHHVPSNEMRLRFLGEAKRVLKPRGLLILTVWNLWQKKTAWRPLAKYSFLKLIGRSKLDFRDAFYPWGKKIIRYFHYFTKNELKNLAREAGFKIKEAGILPRPERRDNNLYLIAEK